MISARFGAAVALVLGVVAAALGFAAFISTLRDDDDHTGRLVQTRISGTFAGGPIAFPLDEFYISVAPDREANALYLYPPGFYGHVRGCKVVWLPDETLDTVGGRVGPGVFVDPCGGARFARDGRLVAGPADRGLDYFRTEPGVEGIVVDTRTLYCGPEYEDPTQTEAPTETPSTAFAPPPFGASTVEATATTEPAATKTQPATPAHTPGPEKCDRVSPNTKR